MARYRTSSYRRNRRRKTTRRRWVYIVLILLVIVTVKIRTRGFHPAFTFGTNQAESVPEPSGAEVQGITPLPPFTPIRESSPREMPDATAKSTGESTRKSKPAPPAEQFLPERDVPETAGATSEFMPESEALIAEITSYITAKPPKIIEARDRLNQMLSMPLNRQQSVFVKKQLSKLTEQWLFSRAVLPQDTLCSNYEVKPGEQLGTIGKEFKIPYEIIMRINNITRPEDLRAGETIKVINGPFHVLIDRSTFTMDLYLQDTFVWSFRVGLGRTDRETPTGLWRVKPGGKLVSPIWTDPDTARTYQARDRDYPLGSRWIGLEGLEGPAKGRTGFAIHGTPKNTDQVGRADSRGCIRMYDKDVILVYDLLVPRFSQVIIVE